ncbi:MAG TPA: anaerobic ribonucleoside-triphosphate reductase [Noviherbaspirillum sp.]|nr:anaerobic ribonucleoside-triphosphate reductase [Noviherbaspirillum sp.]
MTDLSNQSALAKKKIILTDAERQRCEIWTRVMGYHRPLSSFNIGKKGEFHERKYFSEQCAQQHCE